MKRFGIVVFFCGLLLSAIPSSGIDLSKGILLDIPQEVASGSSADCLCRP